LRSVAALLLLAAFAAAQDPLDADSVARDAAVAKRTAEALASGSLPVGEVLKKLAPCHTDENRDIGFGARRVRLTLDGAYTETHVVFLVWKGRAGPVEVVCRADDPEIWAGLRGSIGNAYAPLKPEPGEQGLVVHLGARAGPEGFRAARSEMLGGPLGIDPHPDLAEAYLWLWSPFSEVRYGLSEGEDGGPPPGRAAIEKILAHEDGEGLLEDLLCGPNPESRVYAAEALLRLEKKGRKLPDRVRRAVEWVRNSDVKIHVSYGCELTSQRAKKALAAMLEETGK